MFERYVANQRVAENNFDKNTLSLVYFTGDKPDNEGTAKHELEGESVLDLGCVTKSHKTALLFLGRNSHAQTCASPPLIFTGAASEELATLITSFVDDMLEWNTPNKSRSCVTLHSDSPISHKAPTHATLPKR